MPGFFELDAKCIDSADRFCNEIPFIDKPTAAGLCFEGSDCHDKVIDKFDGNLDEASIHIIIPFLENDKIFFGWLNIVRVENDLAKVKVCNEGTLVEGDVPKVVRRVDYFWVNVQLKRSPWRSDPQAGHEDHHVVARVRLCELGECHSIRLRCVVYVVGIVGHIVLLACDVHLNQSKLTISPAV